ncbi:MAG: peptidoglycan endopeptidase, partial [Clostridiales bacterium]|nr:peptidoglycan endopeptidase [Clostridiales bacterium]
YRDSSGGIGHVTMYIGGGQVVHASSSTTGIIVSNIGYRTPCGAARIIWD